MKISTKFRLLKLFKTGIMENYSIIKRLGAGGFGTVDLAERKKDKKQVVVKEKFKISKIL